MIGEKSLSKFGFRGYGFPSRRFNRNTKRANARLNVTIFAPVDCLSVYFEYEEQVNIGCHFSRSCEVNEMLNTRRILAVILIGCMFVAFSSDADAQSGRGDAMRKGMADRDRQQSQGNGANSDAAQRAMNGSIGQPPDRSRTAGGSSDRGKSNDGWDNEPQTRSPSRRSGGRRPSRSRSTSGANIFETNKLLEFFDSNRDGELSLEEIDAASRLLYSLDENEDDRVTEDEIAVLDDEGQEEQASAPPARSSSRSSSSSRDTSRGRGLSMSSAGTPGATNGSSASSSSPSRSRSRGQGLSMSSAGKPGGSLSGASEGGSGADFDKFDKNSDGVIKRGELSARLRTKFRKMDSNGDSEVDIDEFEDYMSDPSKNDGVIK